MKSISKTKHRAIVIDLFHTRGCGSSSVPLHNKLCSDASTLREFILTVYWHLFSLNLRSANLTLLESGNNTTWSDFIKLNHHTFSVTPTDSFDVKPEAVSRITMTSCLSPLCSSWCRRSGTVPVSRRSCVLCRETPRR